MQKPFLVLAYIILFAFLAMLLESCSYVGTPKARVRYLAEDECRSGHYENIVRLEIYGSSRKAFKIVGFGGFDRPSSVVRVKDVGGGTLKILKQKDKGGRIIEGLGTGFIDRKSGVLRINYAVLFPDGSTDRCSLTLTPNKKK